MTRRELSYAARPAGQDVQVAIDVDDLDQLSGAELVEQVGRAERDASPWLVTSGSQRAGAHLGFQPLLFLLQLFLLQRRARHALAPRLVQAPGHSAQRG